MASIRKTKQNKFVVEIRKLGQYKSKTFDTKTQAMTWALEIEKTITNDSTILGVSMEEVFSRYQTEITPTKKSWRNEHNRLNKFNRSFLSGLQIVEVQQHHIYQWIDEELKRIKSSSVNRDLNVLSAIFEQCKRWNWANSNPVRGIKRPQNPPPRVRRISDEEQKLILKSLYFDGSTIREQRDEIAVSFLLALETAMRQKEIWSIQWEDVYFNERYLHLNKSKNGDERDVPLSIEAIRLLKLLGPKKRGRVFVSNQTSSGTIFLRSVKMAGIENMTFHDTRHEALTRLAQKLPVLDLARMVGHRDPRSLMIYYNPTATEIAGRLDD